MFYAKALIFFNQEKHPLSMLCVTMENKKRATFLQPFDLRRGPTWAYRRFASATVGTGFSPPFPKTKNPATN